MKKSEMAELHVYGNDYEWVIAESLADAFLVWGEQVGETPDEQEKDELDFELLDDGFTLTFWCDAKGNPSEIEGYGCKPIEATCREWAQRGRGYLGTTEQ